MKRVSLTIQDLDKGTSEVYSTDGESRLSLALVFRVVNAAIGAHPEEIGELTAAAQVIRDMIVACAPPAEERPAA
jgi:hypothetical protein